MSCESMPRESKYYPVLLEQQVQSTTHEIYWNLHGLPKVPGRLFDYQEMVLYSLAKFVNFFNRNSCLGDFLAGHLKDGQQMLEGNIFLQPIAGDRDHSPTNIPHIAGKEAGNGIYLDGDYGFILCWRPDQRTDPLILATTSFSPGNRLSRYNPKLSYPDVTTPVVIQLQAQSYSTNYCYANPRVERREMAFEALSRFRWEHALVSIATQWTQSAGFPVINLLPGAQNRYAHHREEQMKMRYDVTAKRCGFKLGENGLYVLPTELIVDPSRLGTC